MTKEIQLTKGYVALVDDDDFERLSKYHWYFYKGYAARMSFLRLGKRRHIKMHQEIMGKIDGMEIDHWDLNKLNDQKENLRICTHAENNRNTGLSSNNTSGYKGVGWHKASRKWRAYITVDGKQIQLGLFETALEAARVYDRAASKYFGDFANTNLKEKI